MPTTPPLSELSKFWLKVAILSPAAAFISGVFYLQENEELAATAGYPPISATVIEATGVLEGKDRFTLATVEYRPDAANPVTCRVAMRFDYNDMSLQPGKTILILRRKVACYKPTRVGSTGDPRLPLCGFVLSIVALIASVIGARRASRDVRSIPHG